MFHPVGHPMERGWVGRIDGDRVIQLAAQTLQSFFTGGGTAREHAEFPRSDVVLLAPVLHPPSIRVFDDEETFAFANPAAIVGPGAVVTHPEQLSARGRPTAVIGADGEIGGFTVLAEWCAHGVRAPKDRDFALGLGPAVVTPDEVTPPGFDWAAAVALAAAGTVLYPGDLLAGPAVESREVAPGSAVTFAINGIGTLEQQVGAP